MAANAYQAFLLDPDQAARRAQLEWFFRPNAHKFMAVYDTLQADAAAGGKSEFRLFGGGFHCFTLDTHRAGGCENYLS